MKHRIKTWSIILLASCLFKFGYSQTKGNCLYKNPLCFFNTDVLNYLQVLHKNQQYNKMTAFFYGSSDRTKQNLEDRLSNANFGYSLKRVGVKEKNKTSWSLTYQRTILGTNETFKIDCALINDTCRVFLDKKAWQIIFKE
jgi:hypothetical protein